MLNSDRSEFACRPKWHLHAVHGGTELAHIPRPYALYNQGQIGNSAKKGIRSPVSEIYWVYTQTSRFFARIPNPASVFVFRHPNRKVLTESFGYTKRYSCSYFKVSEFHLAAVVEVCYCIWQTKFRIHFVSIWILNLSAFPFGKWPGDVARRSGELHYQFLFMDGFLTCLCAHVLDGCSLIFHYKGG